VTQSYDVVMVEVSITCKPESHWLVGTLAQHTTAPALAQRFPTSPEVIFSELSTAPVVSSKIGTYTFHTGDTADAIAIVSPGVPLPQLTKVEGIEIIISDIPNPGLRQLVTYDDDTTTPAIYDWYITVIVWDPATGNDLTAVLEAITEIFVGAQAFESVSVPPGLTARSQSFVSVSSQNAISSAGAVCLFIIEADTVIGADTLIC